MAVVVGILVIVSVVVVRWMQGLDGLMGKRSFAPLCDNSLLVAKFQLSSRAWASNPADLGARPIGAVLLLPWNNQ